MSMKGFKFYHVNTRSLFSKLTQLEILYSDVDVLCCTETWLDNRFSNDLISLPGKMVFRCDRRNNVFDPNARPTAGGVCVYMNNDVANFTVCLNVCCKITQDFEILTLVTSKPSRRHFVTICVYKPPKGKLDKCIDFLNEILGRRDILKKEVWILGDFNTDLLKRNDAKTVDLQAFAKKNGLAQCINTITRPNIKGGSCIDLIMSNCFFVTSSGIKDDMISDHYTVYCIRKKQRETKHVVSETVRDYKNFNKDLFNQLVTNLDWSFFDKQLEPIVQWNFIHKQVSEILAVMCPYKKVHTRMPTQKKIGVRKLVKCPKFSPKPSDI